MKRDRCCRASFGGEDTVRRPGLLEEHGLSALVEWEENVVFSIPQRVVFSCPMLASGVQDLKITVDKLNQAEEFDLLLCD